MSTNSTNSNIIQAQNVSYSYHEQSKNAVENVSIDVKNGELLVVLGANGSGKSTLIKHFNALLQPARGAVFVDKIDTTRDEMIFEIRKTVGMVFQNPDNQIVATIVEDDVAFAPENLGIPPSEIRKIVDQSLQSVGMLEFAKKMPHKLSGGQKQRVAIAGILAMNPKCIILDEATAMLDPKGRGEVLQAIKSLHRAGKTVILVTHFMEEAALADRVAVMRGGEITLIGSPREVFTNAAELALAGLEPPPLTRLMRELKAEGLDVDTSALTLNECVESVKNAVSKNN